MHLQPEITSQGSFQKPPILVIDDNADTCDLLCLFLSKQYRCEAAYDGEQALEKIKANKYAVILSDLLMPNVDGYAVISAAAIQAPSTPVIVVSALADTQSAIKAMRMGAFDYIIKPFEPDHVEVSIKRALTHHILVQSAHHNERKLAAYATELETTNEELSKAMVELDSIYHWIIGALTTALETRDIETRGHSERVVAFSLRLGRELGLDEAEMKALGLGALFHDIGKIGIEDRILLKPMSLTRDEWKEMRKHPEKGARIIEGIPYLQPAVPVVAQHHERWDGLGYPAGLAGEQIDLKARIFAVADAVDAITSERPYDKARSFIDACSELVRGSGRQFDPMIVRTFCRIPLEEWAKLAREVSHKHEEQSQIRAMA